MTNQDLLRALGRSGPFGLAYLGGTFDTLHRGHLALFAAARRIALELCVSVNTDEFAERYKRRPLMPLADRMAVLSSCRLVDRVVINTGCEDSKPAIMHVGPDCLVHGSDWVGDSLLTQMGLEREWLKARGIALVILPYTPWTSTTQLLDAYDQRRPRVDVTDRTRGMGDKYMPSLASPFVGRAEEPLTMRDGELTRGRVDP